jgi:hypothetical protein
MERKIMMLAENYIIYPDGIVVSRKLNRRMKTNTACHGYHGLVLSCSGKRQAWLLHRLIATIFLPNPDNLSQVNHIDGNKDNNRVENLEWCTAKHNLDHARETGLNDPVGESNGRAILTEEIVRDIKACLLGYKRGMIAALAREYGVDAKTIALIRNGTNWKHVEV